MELDYEGELVIVIENAGRRIAREHAITTGTPTTAVARSDPPRWLKPEGIVDVQSSRIGALRKRLSCGTIVFCMLSNLSF